MSNKDIVAIAALIIIVGSLILWLIDQLTGKDD